MQSRDIKRCGPLILRPQKQQLNILPDKLYAAHIPASIFLQGHQLINKAALNHPLTALKLAYFNAGLAHNDAISDECAIDEQPHQADTNADLFSRDQAHQGVLTQQLRIMEFQFGSTESPKRIHARKLDVHSNRAARPVLDLLLILRKARQKQSKQSNQNREQNDDARGRVGSKFEYAVN